MPEITEVVDNVAEDPADLPVSDIDDDESDVSLADDEVSGCGARPSVLPVRVFLSSRANVSLLPHSTHTVDFPTWTWLCE